MKKIIITAFKPFGSYSYNPTEDIVNYLDGKIFYNTKIIGVVLPCTYLGAFKVLRKIIEKENPDFIINMGLASSVEGIILESQFKNSMYHDKYADTDGYRPNNVAINPGVSPSHCHTINTDIKRLLEEKPSLFSRVSYDANSFICNSLGYLTADYISKTRPDIKHIFMHIPWTDTYKDLIEISSEKIFISENKVIASLVSCIRYLNLNS